MTNATKIGRNEPCPCGSGRKYKQCCLQGARGVDARGAASANPEDAGLARTLASAAELREAGRLEEAEALCDGLLKGDPGHSGALHCLGLVRFQQGRHGDAVELIERAGVPKLTGEMANDLGLALAALGRHGEAEARFRQAVAGGLRRPEVHFSLGLALQALGRTREAVAEYKRAFARGADARVLGRMGEALVQAGKYDEAIANLEKAVSLEPDLVEGHFYLGLAHERRNEPEAAIRSYRRAIELRPTFTGANSNLGGILLRQGKAGEAAHCYRTALVRTPDDPRILANLGAALVKQGEWDEAIASLRRALEISPDNADIHYNLGIALDSVRDTQAAILSYCKALEIRPGFRNALNNLALALKAAGRGDEALAFLQSSIELYPDSNQNLQNIGVVQFAAGDLEGAMANWRLALDREPHAGTYSNFLFGMQHAFGATPESLLAEHRRFAGIFETPLRGGWRAHPNERDARRRLRVGYVSGDFRRHSVANFIAPILASHDRSQFEVTCYSNWGLYDDMTERFQKLADHWVPCHALSDEQLAERIRADGIDILVDLSGHTGLNRLPVFARKPAPVQVTWIGYAGTTGLAAMDYRITDADLDPPGDSEAFHTEKLVRLPSSAVYQPPGGSPDVNELPALGSPHFTFGCLNEHRKINADTVRLWSRILAALPDARLMLGHVDSAATREQVLRVFAQQGIGGERLLLEPKVPLLAYLALHHRLDAALDTFPYNGGTTTCHSLWMGVPVISLTGRTSVSRCGATLLRRAGLPDFVAHSEDEYVERAVQVAADRTRLAAIRRGLRQSFMDRHVVDAAAYTRELEAAYRAMWVEWCGAPAT